MSKIYQCDKPGMNLCIDQNDNPWGDDESDDRIIASAGVISFHAVPEPLTNIVFGEVASDNPVLLKRLQIVTKLDKRTGNVTATRDAKPEELEDMIENSQAFKKCKADKTMGVRGIWLKSERQKQIQAEVGVAGGVTPQSVFEGMSEAVLKLHIETEGGTVPVEATKAELVTIAASLSQKN